MENVHIIRTNQIFMPFGVSLPDNTFLMLILLAWIMGVTKSPSSFSTNSALNMLYGFLLQHVGIRDYSLIFLKF